MPAATPPNTLGGEERRAKGRQHLGLSLKKDVKYTKNEGY
jgi:hypothetical protein